MSPKFASHSDEPLTHAESYYFGTPIHRFHQDDHHTEQDVSHSCWKRAAGRTVGAPMSSCPDGYEKQGQICYPVCKEGYHSYGPDCWQNCPKGFFEDGDYCAKPAAYGRGAGQVHQVVGSEKWGSLWYPKCQENYHNVGCCVCSPDCPADMIDIGSSCARTSYSRTKNEKPLSCGKDEVQSGALCYPTCEKGSGVGPVCWGSCPKGTTECGSLCVGEDQICSSFVAGEVKVAF